MMLEPGKEHELYHIGVTPETVAILKAHPIGKTLRIVDTGRHAEMHHGGAILSVNQEQYEYISKFTGLETTVDILRGSVSAIDMAVRKAYS